MFWLGGRDLNPDNVVQRTDDVTFQIVAANDEKRAAVERQLFIIGEVAARLPDDW